MAQRVVVLGGTGISVYPCAIAVWREGRSVAKKKTAGSSGESKRPLEQYTHSDKKRANNPLEELVTPVPVFYPFAAFRV